ncbi:MAG TPA: leucyl/phenylalanyl-tRNA--protein transferase [Xanthobacteraceae bacterium]|nr:leucyl/phenylalanyl-tRNA--protein transferase [Xanthobacteraceae bacterium]
MLAASGDSSSHLSEANAARRAALFRETPAERIERVLLGTAWALQPRRLKDWPPYLQALVADQFAPSSLPDPARSFGEAGYAGRVRDLSVPTLVEAYRRGLFTFAHFGRPQWMSLPARSVLFFDELHIAKRLRRQMRQSAYTVTFDRDFEGVIAACAGRRSSRWHLTWITPRIMHAYAALYDAGHVHSFEVWNQNGALVGGGYGVALGRIFFTESQFSHEDNTSKLGFTVLNYHLARWGFLLNDGKYPTRPTIDMGFRVISRAEFLRLLADGAQGGGEPGRWQVEAGPEIVADWQPQAKALAAE